MKTTVTVHWNEGSTAQDHNQRKPELCSHEEHIDLAHEHGQSFHDVIYRQDLTEAYRKIFDEAIEEYNAGQKRKDRMKSVVSYMDEVQNDNRGKRQTKRVNGKRVIDEQARRGKQLSYEITVKVGNTEREKDKNGRTVYNADGHHIRPEELPRELQRSILWEYVETFQESNPNFKVVNADIHGDEGFYNAQGVWEYAEIHPHIEFIPVAEGFKQGLFVQNSMNKALEAMGCGGADGYDKWAKKEQARLGAITLEHYKTYCLEHPDFALEHGKLEIYHPVSDKLKKGDMDKEQFVREQELNEFAGVLTTTSNRLTKSINNLEASKSSFEISKSEFADYKASELKKLQEKTVFLDKKEKQLESFASRASEMFCDAKDYVDRAKKLYDALDTETKARYKKSLVELDESLLSHQPRKERSMSL